MNKITKEMMITAILVIVIKTWKKLWVVKHQIDWTQHDPQK